MWKIPEERLRLGVSVSAFANPNYQRDWRSLSTKRSLEVYGRKEPDADGSKRKWLAIGTAAVLTISIGDYALYTAVPVKYILAFHLLLRVTDLLNRWQGGLVALGLIGPFFARGRSRLALVVGGTLMFLLWNAVWSS